MLLLSAATDSSVDHSQVCERLFGMIPFSCLVITVAAIAIKKGKPIIKEQRERRVKLERKKRRLDHDHDYDPYASTENTVILMLYGVAMLISLSICGWLYHDQNPDCTWLQIATYIFSGEGMPIFFGVLIVILLILFFVYLFVLSRQTSYWFKKVDEEKSKRFRARINGREVLEYEKNY